MKEMLTAACCMHCQSPPSLNYDDAFALLSIAHHNLPDCPGRNSFAGSFFCCSYIFCRSLGICDTCSFVLRTVGLWVVELYPTSKFLFP